MATGLEDGLRELDATTPQAVANSWGAAGEVTEEGADGLEVSGRGNCTDQLSQRLGRYPCEQTDQSQRAEDGGVEARLATTLPKALRHTRRPPWARAQPKLGFGVGPRCVCGACARHSAS